MPLESAIRRRILLYLRSRQDCFFCGIAGGPMQRSGLPDILICYKGRTIWFEVKNEKGRTTVLQTATLRELAANGCICAVVRSVENAQNVFELIEAGKVLPAPKGEVLRY